MSKGCTFLLAFAGAILLCRIGAAAQDSGQDSSSLGDAARQARQQKQQQAKATPSKSSKPAKVITNEEIPEHPGPAGVSLTNDEEHSSIVAPSGNGEAAKASPEHWKSQIQAQKNQIAALQREADELYQSIHYLGGNCVSNCVQWNERQQQKQQEVERLHSQIDEQKKRLEDMQESARKQGYGGSVYDP